MKNKKLFAILTLVAFMLTMMPVMAFATTSADVYAWVEDGSAKMGGDEVVAYVDFDELSDDERVYVYTVKAGQVYDGAVLSSETAKQDDAYALFYSSAVGDVDNDKIVITSAKPASLTVKAVLVKRLAANAKFADLTIGQVNKGTHDDFDFFAIDVEDANITFKNTNEVYDAVFDYDVKEYVNGSYAPGEAVDANGGVDYYKVTAELIGNAGNGNAVKNAEVTVSINKVGAEVSETELVTNNRGVVTFNVFATKAGEYTIVLSADGAEDVEIPVTFGTAAIGSVKVKAQPTGNFALVSGAEVFVPLVITDVNGNVMDNSDATLEMLNNARDVQFVGVPADSDIEKGRVVSEGYFGKNTNGVICFVANADVAGEYTAKIYNAATGGAVEYVYFSVAKFDKAVSATIAYDATTYMLGADVDAPDVYVYDVNGTKRLAKSPKFSYTGVGAVGFDKDNGSFVISSDDKYLGQALVVNVLTEGCFATATLNIADVPAYLQFDAATAAVGTEASVTVKSLDLKGNVASLGENYTIEEVTAVVTSKPEGAVVSVDTTKLANNEGVFKTTGNTTVAIASNKEGTVTVNVVLRASKPGVEGQRDEQIFLTGIATVDFGGKVSTVSSSATMIIGSNVFVANGGVLTAPVAPAIVDGRTYLPIRALSQALGCEVGYADGVVTITYGTTVVTMTIGSNVMTVGAETVQIDAAPYVVDGTTMVPLRAAATALGYDIDVTYNVDGTVATVTVYKK